MIKPDTDLTGFFKLVLAELGTIPRRGLLYLGLAGIASASAEVLARGFQLGPLIANYIIGGLLALIWTVALYAASTMMANHRFSFSGLAKFFATSLAVVFPLITGLALVILGTTYEVLGLTIFALFLTLFAIGVAALLPGWPISQATSSHFIGPLAALRSTKGFRWPLIAAGLVTSGLNQSVPDISLANNFAATSTLAALGAIVAAISAMIGLSIAVAAWRLMREAPYERS